jgi:type VI secretion system protein VasI
MRHSSLVVAIWLAPLAGVSQDLDVKKAVLQCSTVDGSGSRLDCYDALAASLAQPGTLPGPGQWTVKVGKNPLDDSTVVALSLVGAEYKADLMLGCRNARPEVYLTLRGQVVGANDPMVWTRFGGGKADKKRWSVSADNKAVIFSGDAKAFMQQLLRVDHLTVQLEHFLRGSITEVFDVRGLGEAIRPLTDACTLK